MTRDKRSFPPLFSFLKNFIIGVQLLYTVVVSAVPHSESVTWIHTFPPSLLSLPPIPLPSHPSRSLASTKLGSLCYIATSHQLLLTTDLFSVSVSPLLFTTSFLELSFPLALRYEPSSLSPCLSGCSFSICLAGLLSSAQQWKAGIPQGWVVGHCLFPSDGPVHTCGFNYRLCAQT